MAISLSRIVSIAQAKERSLEDRLSILDALGDCSSTEINANFYMISRTLDTLLSRTLAGDADERRVFLKFIQTMSAISERSEDISKKFINLILNIYETHRDSLDIEIVRHLIDAIRHPLRTIPQLSFGVLKKVYGITTSHRDPRIQLAFINLLSDIAWETPHIVNDYASDLVNFLAQPALKQATLRALISAGKRSFLAVKKFVTMMLGNEETLTDPTILDFLTALYYPSEYADYAENIYDKIYEQFVRSNDVEKRSLGVKYLANLVLREELYMLQDRFLNDLLSLIASDRRTEILISCFTAATIPTWNKRININPLFAEIFTVLGDPLTEERVKIASLEALFKLAFLRPEKIVTISNKLAELFENEQSTAVREKMLELLAAFFSLIKTHPDIIHSIIKLSLTVISNPLESDILKIRAGEILEMISKSTPNLLIEYSDDLSSIFEKIREWEIRDYLVKIAGEIIGRTGRLDPSLINIIMRGLFDELIYTVSLTTLNTLSFKYPAEISRYLKEIKQFAPYIKQIEEEIIREESIEHYYHYVEEPKRTYIRILTNIALYSKREEATKTVIKILVNLLKDEANEIIRRDILNSLKEIVLIDRTFLDTLRETAKKVGLEDIVLQYEM